MTTKEDKKKICFVISPIGEEGSETRERSDQVLKHIITSPAEQNGYTVVRADKISEPGIITTQIIEHIVDAELVIADLTEKKPNVFYELAIRHAIRKPLVQMIRKGDIIPFDVAATRIIQFDLRNLDSVASAKEEITNQIKSLEAGNSDFHNPISVSLDLKVLKESGNVEERSLADIVEAVSDLRIAVTSQDKANISPKYLDELKMMIDSIPNKVESRLDEFRRRRKRFHPMMFDEMMHFEMKMEDPNIGFLMMVSFYRDDYPWIYELGLETYRALKTTKSKTEKRKAVENFERAIEMIGHPMFREMYGESKELYMFSKDIRHMMHILLEKRFLIEEEKPE
ncbi:MAG: hypothetical protein IPK18_14250 [Sphingobacteriales bacterium]|jgi:hypothetical protein|nr:MAG: hypothetical protein IPK18_14250 [Sphingobacteriales bacterium]